MHIHLSLTQDVCTHAHGQGCFWQQRQETSHWFLITPWCCCWAVANCLLGAIFGLRTLLTSSSVNLREVCYPLILSPCVGDLMITACLPVRGVGRCSGALLSSSCGQHADLLLASLLCSGPVGVQDFWAWWEQITPWCLPDCLLSLISVLSVQVELFILLFLLVLPPGSLGKGGRWGKVGRGSSTPVILYGPVLICGAVKLETS